MIIGASLIKGFLGIGLTDFNFNQPGLTLIEGENKDSASALSNGAGKSSLFEAPYWAIYGQTRRGLKGDEVVNRHVRGGCLVAQQLMIKGTPYTVLRTRKDEVYGTTLRFYGNCKINDLTIIKDEVPAIATDMTRGTMKDTQQTIDEFIGTGPLSFAKIVYFGQGDVKPFASLTDAELKLVFEQALGLGWFSNRRGMIKGYSAGVERSIHNIESSMLMEQNNFTLKKSMLEDKRSQINQAQTLLDKWRTNLQNEAELLEETIKELVRRGDELEAERITQQAREAELDNKHHELNELHEKLKLAYAQVTKKQAESDVELSSNDKRLATYTEDQQRIKSMAGTKCQTCLQDVDPLQAQAMAETIDDSIGILHKQHSSLLSEAAKINTKVNKVADLENTLNQQIAALRNEQSAVDKKLVSIAFAYKQNRVDFDIKNKRLEDVKSELDIGQPDLPDVTDLRREFDLMAAELLMLEKQIEQMEKQLDEHAKELDQCGKLADVLGNGGVKSYIFDAVTPELNKWANHYAQILDPDLAVELSTVTKLKSGDYREKFSIAVTNQSGANSLAGSSGGEKQKVNLAIALAFNRLMRSMAGNDMPMMVLDEPFESLDAGSSDQVLELLGVLDAENLFLITHNESVRDLIPNRAVVEKKNGQAALKD